MTTKKDDFELEEPDILEPSEPAKIDRCDGFLAESNPRCYTENTSKEELVNQHVDEYEHQFKVIYDPLRKLLLMPKNEREVKKFICTTIRPTKLPYTQLYEWDKCAKFISDYLEYEELGDPTDFPVHIPSPANVLDWQAGDCFDFAIVLCSLLIGAGYDAYVVYGTAPKRITTKDESRMECPFETAIDDPTSSDDEYNDADEHLMEIPKEDALRPVEDFDVSQKAKPESQYDLAQQSKAKKAAEDAIRRENEITDDEPDYEREDEHGRNRIHAWVLIHKGKRDLQESFFVEPSTGRRYNLDSAPYYSVEAIFNNRNFWINMEVKREIKDINFEFENDNTGEWEYVMINNDEKKGEDDDGSGEEDNADDGDDGGANAEEEVLDMPPPWSPKLMVAKDKFAEVCPKGAKTLFYSKCKVEFFSDCQQVDGLVKRVTLYEDYKKLIIKEIRSEFRHRRDKLIMRRRFPYKFKTIEHYESAKPDYWKKLIQVDDRMRKIYYYHHRRDNLIYRCEVVGKKTLERFKGNPDRLTYRSVNFDSEGSYDQRAFTIEDKNYQQAQQYRVTKMAQEFELDPSKPAEEQIRKTVFNIDKLKVFIYYHYKEGQIFSKPKLINRRDLVSTGQDLNDKDTDKEDGASRMQQFFKFIGDMEQSCSSQLKAHEDQAHAERKNRQQTERRILQMRAQPDPESLFTRILEKSIYEKARDRMNKHKKNNEDQEQEEKNTDFLAPILKKLSLDPKTPLDEEAAIHVKNEALKNLKERLLTRAEIIQRRLNKEQQNLEQAFSALKRKGEALTADEEAKYDREIHKANFRIDILTERASLHYRQSLKRFEDLDTDLQNDDRLGVLRANKG